MTDETPRLIACRGRRDNLVWARFADETQGLADLTSYIEKGKFYSLRDNKFIKKVRIVDGMPTWPDGVRVHPTVLYYKVVERLHGKGPRSHSMAKPAEDRYGEIRPEIRAEVRRVAAELATIRAHTKMRACDYFWGNDIQCFDLPGGFVKWYWLRQEKDGLPDLVAKTDDPSFRQFLQAALTAPKRPRKRKQ